MRYLSLAVKGVVGSEATSHHLAQNGDQVAGVPKHVIVHAFCSFVDLVNRIPCQRAAGIGVVDTFVEEGRILRLDG